MSLNEQELFNSKFKNLIRDSSSEGLNKSSSSSLEPSSDGNKIRLFVFLTTIDPISTTNLRVLLVAKFLTKFLNLERTRVNVLLPQSSSAFGKLNAFLSKFKLDDALEVNPIVVGDARDEELKYEIDAKFLDLSGGERVDFGRIIAEMGLKNYNSTLRSASLKAELSNPHFLAFHHFSRQVDSESSSRWIQVCSNGELYQRQKADLLVRARREPKQLSPPSHRIQYVCVGHVSVGGCDTDALECYSQREAYFRHAAVQRQMITDASLVESNLESLSMFSLVYDLLGTGHHKDVKLAAVDRVEELEIEVKMSEQAAFVLYNCARLSAILDKFKSRVSQGFYGELTSPDELDFQALFISEMERMLCEKYLFKVESLKNELNKSIQSGETLEIRLPIAQFVRFSAELSNSFSKYYSKVHILEDPQFKHLHERMNARVYLLQVVYSILEFVLDQFGVAALKRI